MLKMGTFLELQRSWQREGLTCSLLLHLIIVCVALYLPEQGRAGGDNATLGLCTAHD